MSRTDFNSGQVPAALIPSSPLGRRPCSLGTKPQGFDVALAWDFGVDQSVILVYDEKTIELVGEL